MIASDRHKKLPAALLAGLLLLLPGCEESKKEDLSATGGLPPEFLRKDWPPQEVPVAHIIRRDYRLREGDSVEIIYHVRQRRAEKYRIKIQDVIDVRFPFNPTLNQTEQVQSDGYLYLDLVGKVYVFDRTIDEVKTDLIQRYSKFLKDFGESSLTLSFRQSNVKIAELKEAIKTAPRGQSRLVPITPDGNISLPFIVATRAAGLTIGEVHKKLNQAYKDVGLEELEVTINLQSAAAMRVYVLGEVRIPGALFNRTGAVTSGNELTLLQAIAQSGSYLPQRAELSQVMLIRRRHLPRPQAAIINVHQLLENRKRALGEPVVADTSKWRYDIWLEDGDVIYVPTTDIAKRADYIEYVWTRSIRAVGGFSSSYGLVDAVDWIGPNP